MSGMLASVTGVEEAAIVLAEQADIIDLKDPASGALGRLPYGRIRETVAFVNRRCPVSATVGDLPMNAPLVFEVSQALAETGVDFIKIGLAGDETSLPVIEKLSAFTSEQRLIAVLFADQAMDLITLSELQKGGFAGVMLDTFDKKRGSLIQIRSLEFLKNFVSLAKTRNLLCGLAGSLNFSDIPVLLPLQSDYLGFRSALCSGGERAAKINISAVQAVKHALIHHSLL